MKSWLAQYWLQTLFGFILMLVSHGYAKLRRMLISKQKEQDALKAGMIAVLHDRLFEACSKYLALGYIPVDEAEDAMDNMEMVYKAYHDLGGNGTGTALYEKFKNLKVR